VFAGAGATDTDSEYAAGTNDILVRVLAKPEQTDGETLCYLVNLDDATNFRMGIRYADDKLFVEIGGNTYVSDTAISPSPWGRVVDLWGMLDRSASAYFLCDGATCGDVDISADVATDIDSDTMEIGGRLVATEGWSGVILAAGQFILSGAFPTSGEMAAITVERLLNPDTESPTMLLRGAYATERRLDVDFNVEGIFEALDYNDTTVPNHGTGGDLTIGGGLQWDDVRAVAERCAISIPANDWYTFDATHEATVTADLGGVNGDAICEIIYKDIDRAFGYTDELVEVSGGGGDYFEIYSIWATRGIRVEAVGTGTHLLFYLSGAGRLPVSLNGLHVCHMYRASGANRMKILVDGIIHGWGASVAAAIDLSGNLDIKLGDSSMWDGILALRVWNVASGMTDPDALLRERASNPWEVPATLAGGTLIANYELRAGAQMASSTTIVNQAPGAAGPLTISGGGTIGNITTLAVRGI